MALPARIDPPPPCRPRRGQADNAAGGSPARAPASPTASQGPYPAATPDLAQRVRFLRLSSTYAARGSAGPRVEAIETHMSWVFVAGDHVLKLKKPVRYPYLDFSTLDAREFYCREEVRLNRRLAPNVYLGLCALCYDGRRLALMHEASLPGPGEVIDWLVSMRRLPRECMLDALIARRAVDTDQIDRLAERLGGFYRALPRLVVPGNDYLGHFERAQSANRSVLLHAAFGLRPAAEVLQRADAALHDAAAMLRARADDGCIVDGHGDLRPEHVCLLPEPVVIDALEFNAELRRADPVDEISFLGMECAVAGAAWIGPRLLDRLAPLSQPAAPAALAPLYTACRALLRARLAAAHLLEPQPRRPRRWLPLARRYLAQAVAALDAYERFA